MAKNGIVYADGTFDFSSGVNAARVPTVQSVLNPHGLQRTALAWLMNGTMRGGGLQPRFGWNRLGEEGSGAALCPGGYMY